MFERFQQWLHANDVAPEKLETKGDSPRAIQALETYIDKLTQKNPNDPQIARFKGMLAELKGDTATQQEQEDPTALAG